MLCYCVTCFYITAFTVKLKYFKGNSPFNLAYRAKMFHMRCSCLKYADDTALNLLNGNFIFKLFKSTSHIIQLDCDYYFILIENHQYSSSGLYFLPLWIEAGKASLELP